MKKEEFANRLNRVYNDDNHEGNVEMHFDALRDKETGEIIALVEHFVCKDCGEEYMGYMWVRNFKGLDLAMEMDMWEDDFDDEDEDE